jgi:TRAP transporter 4TM/12TM fusion protein
MVSIYTLFWGNFEHQNMHLAFSFALVFLGAINSTKSNLYKSLLWLLLVAGLCGTAYVYFNMTHLEEVQGMPEPIDVAVGILIILITLETTRMSWGWTLPIGAVLFILYMLFGNHIPGALQHAGYDFDYTISYLCIGLSGVYGNFLAISANWIFLFVVFGSLLGTVKVIDILIELGKLVGRYLQGGPGQTAVVSSSLVGMVTGAAVANVAITGAFTIPYMKKIGYRPAIAGAIEATASTGGQLMPPIMGAAAFLMAFFIGVPYAEVMLAGILPALFFYVSVMFGVQFISLGCGIESPRENPDWKLIKKRLPLFIIPLGVIVVLLMLHFSPTLAAFWAIISLIVLGYISSDTRPKPSELVNGFCKGALTGAKIAVSLGVVGMMAQVLITTGLGLKIAGLVEILSGNSLWLTLILTMIISIFLGCGLPPVAAYALVAMVTAPILERMGVPAMAAHFFVFYFAIISAVTPPVAMGALAGAAIAGASYMKTGLYAFKLSIMGFVIPFVIVYNPILILKVSNGLDFFTFFVAFTLAIAALGSLLYGVGLLKLSIIERTGACLASVLLLYFCIKQPTFEPTGYAAFLITGIIVFAVLLISQLRKLRTQNTIEA